MFHQAGNENPQDGAKVTDTIKKIKKSGARVDKFWILLDNQSTVDVFCNAKLLKMFVSQMDLWTSTVTL
eukprot:scaffold414289_cov24-Attheya_sp.AAC.1